MFQAGEYHQLLIFLYEVDKCYIVIPLVKVFKGSFYSKKKSFGPPIPVFDHSIKRWTLSKNWYEFSQPSNYSLNPLLRKHLFDLFDCQCPQFHSLSQPSDLLSMDHTYKCRDHINDPDDDNDGIPDLEDDDDDGDGVTDREVAAKIWPRSVVDHILNILR